MTTLANFEREAAELESFQFWRFRFVLQSQLAVTSSLKPAAGRHTGRHTQTHKANKYIQIVREDVKNNSYSVTVVCWSLHTRRLFTPSKTHNKVGHLGTWVRVCSVKIVALSCVEAFIHFQGALPVNNHAFPKALLPIYFFTSVHWFALFIAWVALSCMGDVWSI